MLCEVAVALADRPGAVLEDETMKLWIGVLAKAQEGRLSELGDGDDVDHAIAFSDVEDHEERIPFGQALADLAEDHFAFHSAGERMSEGSGGDLVEKRMAILEENMGAMQEALTKLVSLQDQSRIGEQPHSGGLPVSGIGPTPTAKKVPRKPKGAPADGGDLPGLDPAVVQSARMAGVAESQLRSLSHLLAKNTRMQDQPAPKQRLRKAKAVDVLSESEDEEAGAEAEIAEAVEEQDGKDPAASSSNPMEKAVLQLTRIVDSMARKPSKDLEALLDGGRRRFRGTGSYGGRNGKEQGSCIQKTESCSDREPVLHLPDCRGPDGCRFSSKPNGSWSYAPGYFKQSLGRAPVKGAEFSKLGESHMEPCRNPRLFENGGPCKKHGPELRLRLRLGISAVWTTEVG